MKPTAVIEEIIAKVFIYLSIIITIVCLFSIMFHIISQGASAISWDFLIEYPKDMGRGGGIFPAIVSTLYLTAIAVLFSVPAGILTAIYLTEYTTKSPLLKLIKLSNEALAVIPSIILGLFGFAFFVEFMRFHWSVLSGGLTLAIMILPTIIKTSVESIKCIPQTHRKSSLALGATRWQTMLKIVLPSALPGIFTGIILAIGRAVGETAALLLTAGSSLDMPTSIMDPARSLSMHLYILASEGISFKNAYGTATVLIILILAINFTANLLMSKMSSKTIN